MKRSILTLQVLFFSACLATASEKPKNDTTFYINDKVVEVEDDNDQVDVRVYKVIGEGDTAEYKSVYKGVFSDDKNVEKYTVIEDLGFQLPIIGEKLKQSKQSNRMTSHWGGFSVGYSNMVQKTNTDGYKQASFDGVMIRPENSLEWSWTMGDHIIPIYKNLFGLTTGFGLTWRNYCLENNHHFEVINGKTELVSANPGIAYSRSRLRTLHGSLPLLLEWQPRLGSNHKFFLTAGVVAEVEVFANYKITFTNEFGDKIKRKTAEGLNTNLLSLDYMVQIGYGDCALYAKYSPFNFFVSGKGPEAQAISFGIALR